MEILSVNIADVIQRLTFEKMQAQWMRSMAVNMPQILAGKDIKDLPKHQGEPCLVIGAGPSINRFRQLDVLAKSGWRHPIICADRVLQPLLKKGLKPNIVCSVDGDEIISNFYAGSLVKKNRQSVKAVLAATSVHPKVLETCPLEKHFFIPFWDNPLNPTSLTRTFHLMTGKTIMEAYGNSGSCGWAIAYLMGANPVGLLGLDYSYFTDNPSETTYFETFRTLSSGNMEKVKQYYRRVRTWAGYEVLTDAFWLTYLQLFLPVLEKAKAVTYNASPLSIITSDKVKGIDLEEFLSKSS